MSYHLKRGGDRVILDIIGRRPDLTVAVDGVVHRIEEIRHTDNAFEMRVDGRHFRGRCIISSTTIEIRLDGETFVFQRLHGIGQDDEASGTGDDIRATMPGTVVTCHVAAGTAVVRGEPLVTIESMKLQMTMPAPRDGIVERVHVAENATFDRGAILVSLGKPKSPAGD